MPPGTAEKENHICLFETPNVRKPSSTFSRARRIGGGDAEGEGDESVFFHTSDEARLLLSDISEERKKMKRKGKREETPLVRSHLSLRSVPSTAHMDDAKIFHDRWSVKVFEHTDGDTLSYLRVCLQSSCIYRQICRRDSDSSGWIDWYTLTHFRHIPVCAACGCTRVRSCSCG